MFQYVRIKILLFMIALQKFNHIQKILIRSVARRGLRVIIKYINMRFVRGSDADPGNFLMKFSEIWCVSIYVLIRFCLKNIFEMAILYI